RAQRPPVGVGIDLVGARHEPRFDRDHQAGPQRHASLGPAVVGHVWFAVHGPAHAVPTELGVDGVAVLGCYRADGRGDVTDAVTDHSSLDRGVQGEFGRPDQTLILLAGGAQ